MNNHPRPIVFASKCLGFAACRYNGVTIPDHVVDALKGYVDFKVICPEVEIGLGVPREPIRIVSDNNELRLFQPATGLDITDKMNKFASSFLESLGEVDGFILKFRSPSCGIKGVKVYPKKEKVSPISNTEGFFARAVQEHFPSYPIEDEGRLKNFKIREHFLTQLFTFARFRKTKELSSMGALVEFHAENKFLLMTHSQTELRNLGRIVANHEKKALSEVKDEYEKHLFVALKNPPGYKASVNTLMHGLGYFSKKLPSREKKYFLETLDKFKNKKVPLSVPVAIIRSYIVRFGENYLETQTFFDPYPEGLTEVTDSGKGRDIG